MTTTADGVGRAWKDGHECYDCHVLFSITRRKHHCRNCGNVFCSLCSSFSISNGAGKENRACGACYSQFVNPLVEEGSVSENEALSSIFSTLGGGNWQKSTGWSETSNSGFDKYGVTRNDNGNITMLVLNKNNIIGVLPDSFRYLRHLTKISISGNELLGTMCTAIGSLSNLVCLQLNSNKLTGRIPGFLGNCKKLQRLDLSRNQFYGSIPEDICSLSDLMWLHLNNNAISGKIPADIGKLTRLKALIVNNNSMSLIRSELSEKLPFDCTICIDEIKLCVLS